MRWAIYQLLDLLPDLREAGRRQLHGTLSADALAPKR